MTPRLWIAAALLPTALMGCSSDDEPATADDNVIEIDGEEAEELLEGIDEWPSCSNVWVAGQTLPEGYEGCTDGEALVAHVYFECADGETLSSYEDRLWVLTPGEIADAGGDTSSDDDYSKAYDACVS